tara:strand:- start:455 stop:916 length:462 start_codon:yes stop_codon:yes gene_type:complete
MAKPVSKRATKGRKANGRFVAGCAPGPGNPHVRRAAELQEAVRGAVTGKQLSQVMQALYELAMGGDVQAARVLLERIVGKPSDEVRQHNLDLGDLSTVEGVAAAMRTVAVAVAAGDIAAADAQAVTSVLTSVANADAYSMLEERVTQIEGAKS